MQDVDPASVKRELAYLVPHLERALAACDNASRYERCLRRRREGSWLHVAASSLRDRAEREARAHDYHAKIHVGCLLRLLGSKKTEIMAANGDGRTTELLRVIYTDIPWRAGDFPLVDKGRVARLYSWLVMLDRAMREANTVSEPPSSPTGLSQTDLDVLTRWVADTLKGKQRRAMELLIEARGEFPLPDMAVSSGIEWEYPWDNQWNKSVQGPVNKKMRRDSIPYRLRREDQKAQAYRIG